MVHLSPHRRRSNLRLLLAFTCTLWAAVLLPPRPAHALIPTAVGGRPGETDAALRVSLERGLVEPNENENSWQKARWNMYTLDVGHNFGDVGPLRDFFVRLGYTYVYSPAEVSERSPVLPAQCLGRALPENACEFHPSDASSMITPAIGFNVIHDGDFAFGFFLQGNVPIGLDATKFVQPRVDHVGGGTAVGVRLRPWLTYESRLYFGSGLIQSPKRQNATVAIVNVFGLEAPRWLLPWKIGVKLGPYFDGDLTERTDERYDAAYTVGFGEGVRDRIQMMRFAAAFFPYIQITDHAVIELSYVQKLFGYDTPATQFYTGGVRFAF